MTAIPDIDALVAFLADRSNTEPAAGFPRDRGRAAHPGLYSWWADDNGVATLADPLGGRLPSLLYAGQAGATSTRSRTVRMATLASRIGGNHLRGNAGSSTFRKTLSALLVDHLRLRVIGPDRLDPDSNRRVSDWICAHLHVAIVPLDDRSTLAHVEDRVLARLDPPLNLRGVPRTETRARVAELRAVIARAADGGGS